MFPLKFFGKLCYCNVNFYNIFLVTYNLNFVLLQKVKYKQSLYDIVQRAHSPGQNLGVSKKTFMSSIQNKTPDNIS